jgi:small nuclear ribonucleoprotein (snRNP)-like protein
MEESRPLNFMADMIGKIVNVTLKDGTFYKGKLKAFDIHTNIVLENCEEVIQGKRRDLNEVFISGYNLECCWLDEDN